VVNGEIVTSSLYKSGRVVRYSSDVGPMILEYAQQMVDIWNPRIAFTLDIAHTPDGLKIIETNAISSSGFYSIDIGKFVGAIEGLDYEQ